MPQSGWCSRSRCRSVSALPGKQGENFFILCLQLRPGWHGLGACFFLNQGHVLYGKEICFVVEILAVVEDVGLAQAVELLIPHGNPAGNLRGGEILRKSQPVAGTAVNVL